jgi:hypothetical protein
MGRALALKFAVVKHIAIEEAGVVLLQQSCYNDDSGELLSVRPAQPRPPVRRPLQTPLTTRLTT